MTHNTRPLAVYIHWPYCVSKCPYCDFNSHVAATIDHDAWRNAYQKEIAYYAARLPDRRITSVFFGGGTPSLMQPAVVEACINAITSHWPTDDDVEITLEANPSSAEAEKFRLFRAAGVNRLSLGIQSLRDDDLKFLGRAHNAAEGLKAIDLAATTFDRFSFDLIYARKGQTLKDWETELKDALRLAGKHLSLYQLTIEQNTLFHTRANRGEILIAPEDDAATMFEMTNSMMAGVGLLPYEVSNYAGAGQESRHNLTYWHYDDYIGVGPGAHGRFVQNDARFAADNHRAPDVWMRHVAEHSHGQKTSEPVSQTTAMREAIMMGLRLYTGIAHKSWIKKFGTQLGDFLNPTKTKRLVEEGLLTKNSEHTAATPMGMQRLNALLDYLLN